MKIRSFVSASYLLGNGRRATTLVVIIFGLLTGGAAKASLEILTSTNLGPNATTAFYFPDIGAQLSATDLGEAPTSTVTVVEGSLSGSGGPVTDINNGQGETSSDDPGDSVFFANNSTNSPEPVSRLGMDLGSVVSIGQINTYSWHTGNRAPQIYSLYAAVGNEPGLIINPTSAQDGGDPTTVGYTYLGSVDTTATYGIAGGQYAVSFRDSAGGSIGSYRYLLWLVKPTQYLYGSWNYTFYSEFDVLPANAPTTPVISNLSPTNGLPFATASSGLSFTAGTSGTTLSSSGISVILNGADVSADLAVTGSGTTNVTVTYNNLQPDTIYQGTISVTNAAGLGISVPVNFSTFSESYMMIDGEDYNFSGGQFIDNPQPGDPAFPSSSDYSTRTGIEGIDFHDVNDDGNHYYRPGDPVGTDYASDYLRQIFIDAQNNTGDPAITDYSVTGWAPTEWLDFTRTFTNTSLVQVYARVSGSGFGAELDQVTSAATTSNQITVPLGDFISATNTGSLDTYAFVPLTDLFGNPVYTSLSGVQTIRYTDTVGADYLNYLMFVPVTNTAPQRPFLSSASPLPGATNVFVDSSVSATIAAPGVQVVTNSIQFWFGGVNVTAQSSIAGNSGQATVTYQPTALMSTDSVETVKIVYQDSGGNYTTNQWQFQTSPSILNVLVSQNTTNATSAFSFPNINVQLSASDRGNQPGAVCSVIEGTLHSASGPVTDLNDGLGQTSSDDAADSIFFQDTSTPTKGRLMMDLGSLVKITQINTYSWHSGNRAPQVYSLYVATGSETNFDPDPTSAKDGGDPTKLGYTFLANVDTRTTYGTSGGQYAVSLQSPSGVIGDYRYLLWVVSPPTAAYGSYNNTFYSEFDVYGTNIVAQQISLLNPAVNAGTFSFSFATQSTSSYIVQYKNALTDAGWTTLQTVSGTGSNVTVTDPVSGGQRFYRVEVQ